MYYIKLVCVLSLISISLCTNRPSTFLFMATWNIGLEEQEALDRTSSIIQAIRQKNTDIICLQEAWGGPQILRQIYQSVKDLYPHFQVVNDYMRHYISAAQLPKKTYSPACEASDIVNAEICLFSNCSTLTGPAQLSCIISRCPTQFLALYTNSRCWACIFDRYISRHDPLGLNYCGAVNLPQFINTSPGITPNSTEAPWNHSIGLMILSAKQYPLKKLAGALYSEFYITPRGYIITSYENKKLIISNTHVATVETPYPHAPAGTFLNNTYGSWGAENKGQTIELETLVSNYLSNNNQKYKNAIMAGDYNMGVGNFEHTVSSIQAASWNYIHQLRNPDGSRKWYDDYTEMHSLCTRCADNHVVQYTTQYIYDHIFIHGKIFNPLALFTRRAFDELIQINSTNETIVTNLSDHYGVELIVVW